MLPILFKIGPVSIYSYGFMLAIAFFVSIFLIRKQADQQGMDSQLISDMIFWSLIFGIIGARIFYIILNFDYFFNYPLEIIMLQHGGLVWYGGLIFGVLSSLVYLIRHHQNIPRILDLLVPYVALAQSIGRVGCLLNGCCYGQEATWGLYFKVHGAILIPVQVYSSLALLSIFLILRILGQRPHRKLDIFYLYLVLHSLQRFGLQFLRADYRPLILGLGIFQIISLVIFGIGLFGLLYKRHKR